MTRKSSENPAKRNTYGNWPSKISAQLIVSDSIGIDEVRQAGDALFHIERRPQEAGRCVIVKSTTGKSEDMLPPPYSARSRVHEYGGGCYYVHGDQLFFVNNSDQDIYLIHDQNITRITRAENRRFADFSYHEPSNSLIAVCESHEAGRVDNQLVRIALDSGQIHTIESGCDFYASPRLNAAATQLCWQTWNHPNMPWDGNYLWLADIDDTACLSHKKHIAGGETVSTFQPRWSPADVLHFIADDTGWWHLYRYDKSTSKSEQLTRGEKEFGLPQWVFAQSSYAFIDDTDILCCYQSAGRSYLARLSLGATPQLYDLTTDWQTFSSISAEADKVAFIGASGHCFPQLVSARFTDTTTLHCNVIKTSSTLPVDSEYYSRAQALRFNNRHQQTVYANYYPPHNPDCQPDNNSAPPLIVICHGGPTGQSDSALDAKKQFWTSRGFALLDVNYSGSTGYGRAYRSRLDGNWGILDVEDCCDAALFAVSQGLADKDRLIIRGSSAGGYTVLAALTFEQVFSAGASYYGISELSSLARDTHKFEAHYLDRLIAPYPEAEALYQQRSPINHSEQLNCPVIFFQGEEDRVVPKQQAEKMFAALEAKGLPVAAQYFAGEQHGFRQAETIQQALENELAFYQLIFNLKAKDKIRFKGSIQIKNI